LQHTAGKREESTLGSLRFGILSFATAPYADLARRCCEVEELGFDSMWLADDANIPGWAAGQVPWAEINPTRVQAGLTARTRSRND
jgi:alkanesulfonate monooxygenase SsuD/methylene tetrahydromethanopterin reductase-like flavin-dependent oxidoreductase (luciferase family)